MFLKGQRVHKNVFIFEVLEVLLEILDLAQLSHFTVVGSDVTELAN